MPFGNLAEQGRPLTIKDEGVPLTTNASSIDFVGAGVTATNVGSAVSATIPGGVGIRVVGETPTGAVDGVNVTYTLAHTPITGIFALYYASRLIATTDYSLSGTTITMTSVLLPGSTLQADYEY